MEHWNRIKNMIMEEMDLSREVADEEIRKLIDAQIIQCSKENYIPIEERHRLSRELFFDIRLFIKIIYHFNANRMATALKFCAEE